MQTYQIQKLITYTLQAENLQQKIKMEPSDQKQQLPPDPLSYRTWLISTKDSLNNVISRDNKKDNTTTQLSIINLEKLTDSSKIHKVYQDLKINSAEQKSYDEKKADNSNILPILSWIRLEKGPAYFVSFHGQIQITQKFEYLTSLHRYYEKRIGTGASFESDEIESMVHKLLLGLLYLHNSGVVHKNITMKNIMVGFTTINTENKPRNVVDRVVITNFSCSEYNSGSVNFIGENFSNREILNKPPEGFLHTPTFDQKYDVFQMGLVIWNLIQGKNTSGPYYYSETYRNLFKQYRDRKIKLDSVLPCLINVYLQNHGVPETSEIERICKHNAWLKKEFTVRRKHFKKIKFTPVFENFKSKNSIYGNLLEKMLKFLPENRIDAKTALSTFQNITESSLSIDVDEFIESSKFDYSPDRVESSVEFMSKFVKMYGKSNLIDIIKTPYGPADNYYIMFLIIQTVQKVSDIGNLEGFSCDEIESFMLNEFRHLFPYDYDFEQFCEFTDSEFHEIFSYWRDTFLGKNNILENKYAILTDKLVKEFKQNFKMDNWFDLDSLINWNGNKMPFGMNDLKITVTDIDGGHEWRNHPESWQSHEFTIKTQSRDFHSFVLKCSKFYFIISFKKKAVNK